jgi:gamma-glutamylcyclotransferase
MKYFAYGTNLCKAQMQEICRNEQKPGFVAVLPNYKLLFSGWSRKWRGGLATIRAFTGSKVRGAVYEVTDACMRRIDVHEVGYERLNVIVFDEDNQAIQAVTHIRTGQFEDALPSAEYAAIIRQGYKDWRII